ncbi:protein FAM92A isoform X5 [Dermochelys coriacea]|uniref:protein FAM92A isoform X5 n=1 Tax=Dermochelys coriacea TaxID=27794 RepID=UPI001CAA1B96|nr:protein FAM92A isoform X5 [Dermochelys coriacea]
MTCWEAVSLGNVQSDSKPRKALGEGPAQQPGPWAALGGHGNWVSAERAPRLPFSPGRHHDARPRAGRQVERLEAKVVDPLKSYGTIVKLKRDDLKATLTAKNREAKQLSQLERTRQRNPSDRHIISQAESDLQRASMDATRTSRQLEETIDNFEKQKIKDIKSIFSEFITIEMLFHGKALEIYTAAYQNIHNIDESDDLEVFRSSLYPPDYQSRLDIVRANSKSPLQRTGSSKFSSGIIQQISNSRLRKEEEDDEEEEEDDDELEATKEEREL